MRLQIVLLRPVSVKAVDSRYRRLDWATRPVESYCPSFRSLALEKATVFPPKMVKVRESRPKMGKARVFHREMARAKHLAVAAYLSAPDPFPNLCSVPLIATDLYPAFAAGRRRLFPVDPFAVACPADSAVDLDSVVFGSCLMETGSA